jgi:transposase
MDEARVGLIPTYRAMWAKKGQRPTASSKRRYQWRYNYTFVHPPSGEMVNIIGDTVNTDAMSACLRHFADVVGVSADRQVVLVMDGAGWHTSKHLVVPDGVHLAFLPPYSPELQPAECLFPLINEALANRLFNDIAELDVALHQRLAELANDPLLVSDRTRFHWWPRDIEPLAFKLAS